MKATVVLLAVLVPALAKPNGFYHQEYNYQTSSSSYKNHELQHRNDDEGYYSKDGDLEGRLRPHVNAHSQHSEYVNPKLQHGYRIGTDRTSSFGQLHAQNRFRYGEPPFQGQEMVGGAFPYNAQDYGVQSNLRTVTTRLEQEMERELQQAVYDHYQRAAAYGGSVSQAQVEADRRILEEELRRNVTMRMQEALKTHYGNQGVRGGSSYSIVDGRLQPVANYNTQELADLTRQMEANLMRHLAQQVQTQYHTRVDTQVHTQRNTYRNVNGVQDNYPSALQQRPVIYQPYPQPVTQPHPPVYPQTPPRPMVYPQSQPQPRPHPVPPIPDSITTVATRVQTELNEILNKILEDTQRRYFVENSFHSGVNYDSVLAQLQDELRANITFHFDDQIKRAYGYTNYASKYSMEDIENLRRQIESNLITKLNRDFNRQREKYMQVHRVYVSPQPIPANQAYYPVNNVQYHGDIATMQRQLQEQLSRQLQTALMQQSYRQANMYTGSNFNPNAHYQASLQQMSAELNRNLTRQMELLNARQFQSGAHADQLVNMRNQLQQDLMRQLQQGLQQSFSRYSSWSSSSSGSASSSANYRPVRGSDPNVYNLMGEDCMMGDDPSTGRKKRSPMYGEDISQVDDLTQQVQTPENQDLDDLTQQVQTPSLYDQRPSLYRPPPPPPPAYIPLRPPPPRYQTQDDAYKTDPIFSQQGQNLEHSYAPQHSLNQGLQKPVSYSQTVPIDVPPEQRYRPRPSQQIPSQYPEQRYDNLQQGQTLDDSDLTQQVQSSDLTQQRQPIVPQVQPQVYQKPLFNIQRPRTYTVVYTRLPTEQRFENIQQSQNLETQPLQPRPVGPQVQTFEYEPKINRPYTSNYDWHVQRQNPEGNTVNHRIRYYENLHRQRNEPHQRWKPIAYTPKPTGQYFSQQTFDSDVTQNVLGQQTTNDDLTQQIRDPGSNTAPQQSEILNQQTQDDLGRLTQQQAQLYTEQQNQDLTQQTQDLGQQTQDLTQQSEDLTQQSQDLTQQTQDLTQETRYLPYQHQNQKDEDLTQQTQDLTQQDRDLNQQTRLPYQIEDLTRQKNEDLTQQTQDLTQQNDDLTQQTEDLTQQSQDLTEHTRYVPDQSQDLTQGPKREDPTQQTDDLTQQSEDLSEQNRYVPNQSQDSTQQAQKSEDLTQQTEDLTQQNQYFPQQSDDLSQQTKDLIQDEINQYYPGPTTVRNFPQQSQDLTQQSRDLTQQTQDLTQQTEDLEQDQYHTQQNEGLTQQTEDLTQQSQDLTQQTEDQYQQTGDLTQQNEHLPQQSQDLTQQSEDLTQQSQDLTQQTEELTQQTEDQYQQSGDLTQQNEDLTQQTQDLTQQTEDQHQQSEEESTTIVNTNQQNGAENPGSRQQLIEAQRESQHLIDLLREQSSQNQQQNQVNGPMRYSPQPVYQNVDGHPVQIGTTRQLTPNKPYQSSYGQVPEHDEAQRVEQPQVNYAQIDESPKIETTKDIEPVQPEVANEVETVRDPQTSAEPEEAEVTTKKPGWWQRFKNKVG